MATLFSDLEVKGGAPPGFAFGPYLAAHTLDRLPHDRQANACSGIIFQRVQALKDLKNSVVMFHIEAHAVVAHPQSAALLSLFGADLDARLWGAAGELDSVVQVVAPHLRKARGISKRHAAVNIHRETDPALFKLSLSLFHQGLDKRAQFDWLGAEGSAFDTRIGQQVVNQLIHALGRIPDGVE